METTDRPYDRDQLFLLPPSLRDWLPEDHLVFFLSDSWTSSTCRRSPGSTKRRSGGAPSHPRMMTKLLLSAYAIGLPSSRKIAQRCQEDGAVRVLTANTTPDFRTISDFRKRHLAALQALFVQVLRCCQQAGLVKLGTIALDGTKVRANASKHKAMRDGRMQSAVAPREAEVRELLVRAEQVDAAEDARYGADHRGDELPAELARRETRLAKIRAAMAAPEAEAQAAAAQRRRAAGGRRRPRRARHPLPPRATAPIPTPASCGTLARPASRPTPPRGRSRGATGHRRLRRHEPGRRRPPRPAAGGRRPYPYPPEAPAGPRRCRLLERGQCPGPRPAAH
jgi:transposase